MNDNRKDQKQQPSSKLPGGLMMIAVTALVVILLNALISVLAAGTVLQVPYNEFVSMVKAGQVVSVEIQSDRLLIQIDESVSTLSSVQDTSSEEVTADKPPSLIDGVLERTEQRLQDQKLNQEQQALRTCYTGRLDDPDLLKLLEEYGVRYFATVQNSNPFMDIILQWVLPLVIIYGLSTLLFRSLANRMGGGRGGGGFMSIGQSNAKVYMEKKTGVTFDDVAGQEEAKESLTEIVDFLHNPEKYTAIGAKQPKGALLVGPPGTGKTLLAKAVAGEANVVFFSLSGSDFVEMFVGVGASRVRDLFKQASQQAPCIIFIDEIDAIGKSRDNQLGSNDEREQTLNQLLSEMDGFDSSKGVVILGATNRPEILDKALLRPGRFDRRIIVERPDLKGREDVLRVHAKKVKMSASIDLHKIALATPGAAGADLANMINEGALRAVRMNRKEVMQEDLMEAVEIVIAGKEKKDRIMSEKEKRIVAYHEIGHALASALQKDTQPVQKITIVPRTMGSLGYVLNMPDEERFMSTQEEMLAQITSLMAGRAAEQVEFNVATTGASNDIERATKMARSMVSMYGMSETFGLMGLESIESKYLDGRNVLTCSEQTGAQLDSEVKRILKECYDKALSLLQENQAKLQEIAEYLFSKETITGEEFMEILKREESESFEDLIL